MRKWLLICWLALILCGISFLFWHNEWKYNLPTPIPLNYKTVTPGTFIGIKNIIDTTQSDKPAFLHFFNPDCPCSRFNITHFKSLVKQYGNKINFSVVVISNDTTLTAKDIQRSFDLQIPVSFDKSIATRCGVYSTPQAVLIGTDHKLYYRGNYNKSRYCTDEKSNYAQMAIDSLLNKSTGPVFGELATKSYGCQLPGCDK